MLLTSQPIVFRTIPTTQPVRCYTNNVSQVVPLRQDIMRNNHLSVVAVNHERVIGRVKHQSENVLHRRNGNCLFLCALHVEDVMLDTISAEESIIAIGEVLLDQCAKALSATLEGKRLSKLGNLHHGL